MLKTRFEIVGMNEYKSIYDAIVTIKKQEGVKGFYRGIIPTLIRDVPASGIQYSCYQNLLKLYTFLFNKMPQDKNYVIAGIGSISSVIALLICYPFDNIRVRY